jgi:DNA invertase Pin-like site-specific DNA recombinase
MAMIAEEERRMISRRTKDALAWVGTAADLAERGWLGVYPISGWWKDQPKRDRSNIGAQYSLVVSIETDAEGVDIWTPVAQEIDVPVEELEIET